ncbi:type VII secretion-associated protein [Corynebacterium callunae]|uniref:type VII secretion-associated protein n=1 Tax=Corynebacterium callunae TaxID=1721 RepID=UPI003982D158
MNNITVTVLETATIFEGPDTVYRYDIMAAGIIEGWAVPAVVDQVKQLASVNWPEPDVIIDAEDDVVEMLTKIFIAKGVSSYPIETLREYPLPALEETPQPALEPVKRPTSGRTVRHFYGIRPLHVMLVSALVGVVVVCWFVLLKPAEMSASPAPPTTSPAATAARESATKAASTSVQPTVLVTQDLLVEAPRGFQLKLVDDTHQLVGPDPNLRIHLGVDPLHGADTQLVAAELRRLIANDPALEEVLVGEWGKPETIDYVEEPGDGSKVLWVTWFEADRQLSVGCHSRQEETLVHRATCRSVIEKLALK